MRALPDDGFGVAARSLGRDGRRGAGIAPARARNAPSRSVSATRSRPSGERYVGSAAHADPSRRSLTPPAAPPGGAEPSAPTGIEIRTGDRGTSPSGPMRISADKGSPGGPSGPVSDGRVRRTRNVPPG